EENNFGIRKRLLEYDDVMNKQRSYIYARRHHALVGERVGIDIANMLYDCVENLVKSYDGPNDYADLQLELYRSLTLEMPVTEEEYRNMDTEERIERVHDAAIKALDRRSERIREIAWPVIARIVENNEYTGRIVVPITDGKRLFNLRIDLQQAYDTHCNNIVKEWHKAILLVTIDELWKEHLRELDQLRQSVQNASYEQKDPLVIYKVESFHLFENMLNELNVKALSALMRGQIPVRQEAPAENRPAENQSAEAQPAEAPRQTPDVKAAALEAPRTNYNQYRTSRAGLPGEEAQRSVASAPQGPARVETVRHNGPRIGRNDPCPCGSGKKYKNCCGRGK
ncbi:MAG: SEC-C domain-containing protein, partial [Muribaculaceae bacterium]|nr:SEC-C domain-containing protein [Muribaculaceae bacterium]